MFAELLAHPGVVEDMVLGSRFGVMAFHGGSLEQATDVVARAVAARSGASLYVVALPPGLRWHVPSRLVTAAASARLARFLDHVEVVLALHGFGRPSLRTTLLLGGSNRPLARHVAGHLGRALPHYEAVAELDRIPVELRGLHPDNPVNRTCRGGVQVELPPRVRGLGPFWAGWREGTLTPDTAALVEGLAAAATEWAAAGSA